MAPTNRAALRSLVAGVALVATLAIPAFAQKTAYVASEEILNRMTEVKEGRARLAEMQTTWMREIQAQEAEIAKVRAEIDANRLLWSTQERREAEGKLKDLETKLAQYRAAKYDAGGEYEKLNNEILAPLYDKVFKAINEEAKAQKFDFVFDKSSRGMPMLYANPEFDLTAAVLRRLGVKIDTPETTEGTDDQTTTDGKPLRRGHSRPEEEDPNKVLNPDTSTEGSSSK